MLNSGGIDSLAAILLLKDMMPDAEIHSLIVWIGQKNFDKQAVAAEKIASEYCDSHKKQVMIDALIFNKIPYRTTFYHIVGAMYARYLGVDYLASGIDNSFSENFVSRFMNLLAEEQRSPYVPTTMAPVHKMHRGARMELAKTSPLYDITVSCEEAEECGECTKCLDRRLFDGRTA